MSNSTFEKVLLSAILTSCTVFSASTLAFVPRQPKPITADFPSPFSDGNPSIEDISRRDVVIRHIGISIVVSVGAGIATAELVRKWGRLREFVLPKRSSLGTTLLLQEAAAGSTDNAANLVDALVNPAPQIMEDSTAVLGSHGLNAYPAPEFEDDRLDGVVHDRFEMFEYSSLPLFHTPTSTSVLDTAPLEETDINWFSRSNDTGSVALKPLLEETLTTVEDHWQPVAPPILTSYEQYQTCRISLPDTSERRFAILFEGQYYQFVKTTIERDVARNIATRLTQSGESVVITESEAKYAVWTLEPDAFPAAIV